MSILADVLMILGCTLTTLAVAGVLRFPRAHARIHAAAEAVLGVYLVLAACATAGGALTARALLVASLLVVSAPVSGHVLARLETLRMEERAEERDPG